MSEPTPRPETLAVWRRWLEAHTRIMSALDAELRSAHDLTLEWYDVLLQLSEAGGTRTMSELADALLISRSNCTRLVDRMEAAGLVERRPGERDQRERIAVLRPAGRRRLRAAAPTHLAGIERRFTGELGREAAAVERFLRRLP
jgi:DNA-binding MarR family transcriptional regulator